jgi:hypothetical protein
MRATARVETYAPRRAAAPTDATHGAALEIVRPARETTAEDIRAMVTARVQSALDEAMQRERQEIAEPEGWWNLYALGPIQPIAIGGPLLPHQVIKVGEPAFIATVVFLNPFLVVAPGTTAADVLSNFALPYEVRYQAGNVTSWTIGQADMNVVHSGVGFNLVPGQIFYVDVLQITGSTPGLYEMNISSRILGATPPFVNAPQFAGYARAVADFDPDLFLAPVPGFQFDQPIRFQIYP